MHWDRYTRYFPIACIIVLSTLFRFTHLDRIPPAIGGDELLYAETAKSIWLTGHDITGTWNPLSVLLFQYPPGERQAELPYFLHLLFSAPFPFSLFLAKLPFTLLSVGIVLLLYGIADTLFGKATAIAVGVVAAVNPWLVTMGRTGYEAAPAMFFYLLALYMLLTTQSWNIFWSVIPLLLAFYSYIATKLIFIPFAVVSTLLVYHIHKRQFRIQYMLLCFFCLCFVAGFVLLLKTSPEGSRLSELMLPNSPAITSQVDQARKSAIQIGILPIIVNKYTVYGQVLSGKLFRIFSPTYLFVEGDQFFLPVRQSFLYYIDFVFLALGTLFLFTKKRFYTIMLWLFIVVGTVPHIFHKTPGDFSIHLTMMFPFIIILIGAGIAHTIQNTSKRFQPIMAGLLLLLYGLNVANFSVAYFTQYPLIGAGDFPMRVLTRYLNLTRESHVPITVYTNRSGDLFKKYLFYSNAMSKQTMSDITHINTQKPFVFHGIRFTDCDTSVAHTNQADGIVIVDHECGMDIREPALKIAKLTDGGEIYKLLNDAVCATYTRSAYPTGLKISDFAVEQLPKSRFCTIFISR